MPVPIIVLQKSLETAAADIACQPLEEWSPWVLYVIIALENNMVDEGEANNFISQFKLDFEHYLKARRQSS